MATDKKSSATLTDREELLRCFGSVLEDVNGFLTEADEKKREERREKLGPLCFMKRVEWKIQIAWGGPEYGFKLYFNPECREWICGIFYWADWFKYEEESLSPSELENVVEAYSMDAIAA